MTAGSAALADRVRDALAGKPPVREVKMFGGLSFMVDERLAVSVGSKGDLLVRADPGRPASCSPERAPDRPRWALAARWETAGSR